MPTPRAGMYTLTDAMKGAKSRKRRATEADRSTRLMLSCSPLCRTTSTAEKDHTDQNCLSCVADPIIQTTQGDDMG